MKKYLYLMSFLVISNAFAEERKQDEQPLVVQNLNQNNYSDNVLIPDGVVWNLVGVESNDKKRVEYIKKTIKGACVFNPHEGLEKAVNDLESLYFLNLTANDRFSRKCEYNSNRTANTKSDITKNNSICNVKINNPSEFGLLGNVVIELNSIGYWDKENEKYTYDMQIKFKDVSLKGKKEIKQIQFEKTKFFFERTKSLEFCEVTPVVGFKDDVLTYKVIDF